MATPQTATRRTSASFDGRAASVQAWAEDTAIATAATAPAPPAQQLPIRSFTTIKSETIRGTSVTLAIPLDEASPPKAVRPSQPIDDAAEDGSGRPIPPPRKKILRRDSLERREALLKGKEGSRRRQRWENDRLLNNPWAQPPLPSDWEVQPTYPRTVVPYFLAPLWEVDAKSRARRESTRMKTKAKSTVESRSNQLPRELREKLKRTKSARGLLMDLENEVRQFIENWNRRQEELERAGLEDAIESDSDDEVVFVGRQGEMKDVPPSPRAKHHRKTTSDTTDEDMLELEQGAELGPFREKLVFGGLANDQGASFARWIVHSIGDYYGLRTWSVTVGPRRDAYVAIDSMQAGGSRSMIKELPRPLWGLV